MTLWIQNLLVMLLVGGCLAYTLWGSAMALFGKGSRIGSCCAKGCSAQRPPVQASNAPKTERIVFLPVEFLGKPRR